MSKRRIESRRPSRVLHFPANFKPDDDPHTKAVYDTLNVRDTEVSAMHPLTVWLDREFLIAEVEASIQSIYEKFDWAIASDDQKEYIRSALQQRVEFLEQLRSERTSRVYVCVYMESSDPELGLGEDDDGDGMPIDVRPPDWDPLERYGDLGDLDETLETDLPI